MNHYYVVLNSDDEGNLLVNPTERSLSLELFAEKGTFPAWDIIGEDYIVTIYGGALEKLPVGENKEEIESLVLTKLGLMQHNTRLEINLVITQSPNVDEFRDSVGVDLVISATGIAICGIFVWARHQADLKIYETSLLRVNVGLYIEVFKTAAELANRLAESGVQTLDEVKNVLLEAVKTFDQVNLIVQ